MLRDAALVARICAGDKSSFHELIAPYRRIIYGGIVSAVAGQMHRPLRPRVPPSAVLHLRITIPGKPT